MDHLRAVDDFLKKLEINSNSPYAADAVDLFAEVFLAAGPDGARAVRSADFATALNKRKDICKRAGCKLTTLVASHSHALDGRYVLVQSDWQVQLAPEGEGATAINLSSSLVLDMAGEEPKAVMYIAHQDMLKMIEKHHKAS